MGLFFVISNDFLFVNKLNNLILILEDKLGTENRSLKLKLSFRTQLKIR